MIKELKVNFYRVVRSKSFVVILILLILGAVFSSVEIKFLADNPFNWIENAKVGVSEAVTSEEDQQSFNLIFTSIDSVRDVNKLSGVVRMTMCSDLVCFLYCIFVALFISAEYKSRYHVNHFSLNNSSVRVVFLEWLSLMMVIVLVESIRFIFALSLSFLLCDSFAFDDVIRTLAYIVLIFGVMITFATFTFMIAYLRRSGGLAIVLSSLFCLGFFDFFLGIISVWIPFVEKLSLNMLLSSIALNRLSAPDYVVEMIVVVLFIAAFLTVPLIVSSKRDSY